MTQRMAQAFRHVAFEDLGSFEAPLCAAGYAIEYVEMAESDPAA
jgi:GMP synthase (glutamine-hydrolysing)